MLTWAFTPTPGYIAKGERGRSGQGPGVPLSPLQFLPCE